jgi:hypothetical protein
MFQPFLRFWGLCGWLLWVFKFFFGFCKFGGRLEITLLHSFHSALGESEAPFFGVSLKRKRKKRRKRTPFFAVPSAGLVRWWVGCAASGFASAASCLHYVG